MCGEHICRFRFSVSERQSVENKILIGLKPGIKLCAENIFVEFWSLSDVGRDMNLCGK